MSSVVARLPLQRKVSLALLLTIAAFMILSYVILSRVISPAFDALELSAARTDLIRAGQAIRTDIENLEALTLDWGPWDDIYEYVSGRNPGFTKSNLDRPTLENLSLDMMAVYRLDSELMWSQLLYEGNELDITELGIVGPDDPGSESLTRHLAADSTTVGIVMTNFGPMIIGSQPILRSDSSGPVAGALVMAQFLNDARLSRLRERTEVDMTWYPVDEFSAQNGIAEQELTATSIHIETGERSISSFTLMRDIFNQPVLVLDAETPRQISALGGQTVQAALMFLGAAGLLVTIVMWFLLRGTILRPIEQLAKHMQKIRESGDLSHRIRATTDDEIGALATQFDDMTADLDSARKALLFQSFKAGKADTAAEVLHNIRNAMTPMINGLERLGKAFKIAEDLRVEEATSQLMDPECPPQKAGKFAQYIDASFKHIKSVNEDAAADMKVVSSQARQIEAILSDQEKFANAAPVEENIFVNEVVSEAAHVIPKDAERVLDVEIDEGLNGYRVRAHRIGLLQVLGNLILNAYESIQRRGPGKGRILLLASDEMVDDKHMVRLTVSDNGSGFDEEMGQRIFQRGYTSKSEGSTTGLGLHWCANAVAGMGGRISAKSNGQGLGAEFHVLLPAAQGG